jgi:hypothetical protein
MHSGYITRGQGCRVGDRFGVIFRRAAEVDGEQFVIVKFRDGEQLVSVLELSTATPNQTFSAVDDSELEIEEAGEGAEELATRELELQAVAFSSDQLEPEVGDEDPEEKDEVEEEVEEETEDELA